MNNLFPARNLSNKIDEIFFDKNKNKDTNYIKFYFKRNTSSAAISIANQFFVIEEIILDSFKYVYPFEQNAQTSSAKFATVIRESCNLFEIISRELYSKLFIVNDTYNLNIKNFLSLDFHLKLSTEELRAPTLNSYFSDDRRIEPFATLKSWSQGQEISSEQIPKWWKAYNKIKHSINDAQSHATLENALYSFSALFLLIRKVYGDGLISGFLRNYIDNEEHIILYQIKTSDLFIGEILKSSTRPPINFINQ